MREIQGDLWTTPSAWKCITTNGSVRKDGKAVMGRGCAFEASQTFPELPRKLGAAITEQGNRVFWWPDEKLITFPVKHFWYDRASMALIVLSATELGVFAAEHPDDVILLPRPGCGNGRLLWSDVQPNIAPLLPDNVVVISHALQTV